MEIMAKPRVIETDQGIQGQFNVAVYDQMQRTFRDRGWIETGEIIKHGITRGHALEVGPGPGYLGLEWLRQTEGTRLTGLDISPDMIATAEKNAREYGLSGRVEYVCSNADIMPFDDNTFDAVFTNGSLHEWADPKRIFDEIGRVVKPGGRVFISDLRRDAIAPVRWFLWLGTSPAEIRPGLVTSLNAAYTPAELRELLRGTRLAGFTVSSNLLGLTVFGTRPQR
jgi:ubiquinone/menaquinone biosynthesis C-methylase UbiE